MKIGILGGTFDPPHRSHLALAKYAIKELQLDEVIFIPTWKTPLKSVKIVASPQQRLKMLELMIQNETCLSLSDIEITRKEISYTIDTLSELHVACPAEYWLLMGSDAALYFMDWKTPEKISSLCRLAVSLREPHSESQVLSHLPPSIQEKVDFIHSRTQQISSTMIRGSIGQGIIPSHFLNQEVVKYIQNQKLYKL